MPTENATMDDLDFDRADFTTETRANNCTWCTRGLRDTYFDVQGHHICAVCAESAREVSPQDTRTTFWRSVLFGSLAAAMAGMAYFSLFRWIDDGWMAVVSIGVGYVVGYAMRVGSNGVGGRRYQMTAALLTYIAVVIASAPALLNIDGLPGWAYPLLVFTPIVNLFLGHISVTALQILFVAFGAHWAWQMMAGGPLRISGPHTIPE